jgi:flagellar hook assembly protein FlgD
MVLRQNHPNPFNPSTTIDYYLPDSGPVTLDVYDASGRRIVRLVDSVQEKGNHTVEWNGRESDGVSVSSGVYFYRISSNKKILSRKMILLK